MKAERNDGIPQRLSPAYSTINEITAVVALCLKGLPDDELGAVRDCLSIFSQTNCYWRAFQLRPGLLNMVNAEIEDRRRGEIAGDPTVAQLQKELAAARARLAEMEARGEP